MKPDPQSSSPNSPSPTQLAVSLPGVALSAPIKAALFSEMTEHPARRPKTSPHDAQEEEEEVKLSS